MKQYRKLQASGAEPIPRPSEINFGDNEVLQKSPGRHHLPEFQECGTYFHPNLVANRLRVAKDRLKRFDEMKSSEAEQKKYGNNRDTLLANIEEEKSNLKQTLTGKNAIGKILRGGGQGYPYRIVGMDYASILEDFEEGTKDDFDVQVKVPTPVEVINEEPETKEERPADIIGWNEIQEMSDPELIDYMAKVGCKVHPATGRVKRLEAIRAFIEEEPVNLGEPDVVAKAESAAKAKPGEDLSSDEDEDDE